MHISLQCSAFRGVSLFLPHFLKLYVPLSRFCLNLKGNLAFPSFARFGAIFRHQDDAL
jgi:hypothetical protein